MWVFYPAIISMNSIKNNDGAKCSFKPLNECLTVEVEGSGSVFVDFFNDTFEIGVR